MLVPAKNTQAAIYESTSTCEYEYVEQDEGYGSHRYHR